MKNKVLAALLILKLSILATWFITTLNPFTASLVSAGLPPESADHVVEIEEERPPSTEKGLILAIERKDKELRLREDELNEKMTRLAGVKGDIQTRIAELKDLVKELKTVKGKIDAFNNAKARRLVKIYENMAPQSAAARIERLDDAMAASILGSMREKIAGKILGFINVDKSVKISRVLKKDIR
ncbi:MAG: MotE family protein [Thermodesulfobacteriota bacterium]